MFKSSGDTFSKFKDDNTILNEKLAEIQAQNEVFISKLVILGGYSRKDIVTSIAENLKVNGIVFDSNIIEHWALVNKFLDNAIQARVIKNVTKANLNDFYVSEIDTVRFVYSDFQKLHSGIKGRLPEEVNNLIGLLS